VKQLIEPLTRIPGVRTAALLSKDGVLIAMHRSSDASPGGAKLPSRSGDAAPAGDASLDPNALAGLATGWISEISRAVAPLSWQPPTHIVLRAARGTMIIADAPGAVLCIVLESGMQPEELRLPMEVTVARMQRHLRDMGQRSGGTADAGAHGEPRAALPSRSPSAPAQPNALIQPQESNIVRATGKGISDVSGE
jgi:predicted regulator of Ras-like GTPase activity (Roadblock/LC7/MglB family)